MFAQKNGEIPKQQRGLSESILTWWTMVLTSAVPGLIIQKFKFNNDLKIDKMMLIAGRIFQWIHRDEDDSLNLHLFSNLCFSKGYSLVHMDFRKHSFPLPNFIKFIHSLFLTVHIHSVISFSVFSPCLHTTTIVTKLCSLNFKVTKWQEVHFRLTFS